MSAEFTEHEVKEILRRAIERDASRVGTMGPRELLDIATELGVSTEDVSAAIAEVTAERELQRTMSGILEQRRRALGGALSSWVLTSGILFGVDWLTGPGWWVQWPVAAWGLALVFQTRRAYFADRDHLRRKAQARIERLRRRDEKARRRERNAKLERGLELALERGVSALVNAATKAAAPPDDGSRQRCRVSPAAAEEDPAPHATMEPEARVQERGS